MPPVSDDDELKRLGGRQIVMGLVFAMNGEDVSGLQ